MLKKRTTIAFDKYYKDARIHHRIGKKLFDSGRNESALHFLMRAVELDPYNAEYKFALACLFSEMDRLESSNELMTEIIKNIDPGFTECYFGIGCNFFEMGNLEKAREYFEKYLHFAPEGPLMYDVYDLLYCLGIYDESRVKGSIRRKAVRLSRKGEKLLQEENMEKAEKAFDMALECYPGLIGPRIHLSDIYFLQGKWEKAICMAKSILSLDPVNVEAHCRLALFYAAAGNKSRYAKQVKELQTLKPSNEKEMTILRETCSTLGEFATLRNIEVGEILKKGIITPFRTKPNNNKA